MFLIRFDVIDTLSTLLTAKSFLMNGQFIGLHDNSAHVEYLLALSLEILSRSTKCEEISN
jgi:hypothetical protein